MDECEDEEDGAEGYPEVLGAKVGVYVELRGVVA
jgi:hypothetical protein